MSSFLASIRGRVSLLVAGMAVLASLAIGLAYAATEPDRIDVQQDGAAVSQLYDLATQLTDAIHEQENAIDDHLVLKSETAVARYRDAVSTELRVAERIQVVGTEFPDVTAAAAAIVDTSDTWRHDFAEPAIEAVASESASKITAIIQLVGHDQQPTIAGIESLVQRLNEAQATISQRDETLARTRAAAGGIGIALMLLAAAASLLLVRRWVTRPLDRLLATANDVEAGRSAPFAPERDDEIGRLGLALERMRLTLYGDAERSSVLNRFTEVTTFAGDDTAVANANLEALDLLVHPDGAVTHVLNRSKDRAVPEATRGGAVAEVLPLNALSSCPGIVRGSIYVTTDASAPLSVHCPIYPVTEGTLACVPLAHGELVGSVHLAWARRDAFPLELRASVARIAEHAALAIANRRLLAALQGMASTDARTGLANTRSFDQALEDTLAARREGESVAVLMLDLDHFKDFNDRYGHPAGDEALRRFADVLRSCLREGDVAARYGGEEFAVMLPAVDEATAATIAERIRSRTETTVISLAPGLSDRISVSIGIAVAPDQAQDRIGLLRLADEALYRAKQAGRNRIELGPSRAAPKRTKAMPAA
jgi:diguanylate cyclase (GGDEF)-like protein